MNRDDFDLIMTEIASGLNGDPTHDISYLKQQAEAHKDNEFAKEIARACGRLIFSSLSDDTKAELERLTENHRAGIASVIDEAQFNMYRQKFGVAKKILSAAVERVERLNMYQDDAVSEYHTFNSPFEDILYQFLRKPEKTVRQVSEPFAELYLTFGNLLFELKEFDAAEVALEKAARWNPIDPNISFEHGEIFKQRGDMEKFYAHTLEIFKRAYTKNHMARCYRNLGYYFVEKRLWKVAAACYLFSTHYDRENSHAQSELWYIQQNAGKDFSLPTHEEIEQYVEKYKIPLAANADVVGLAIECGRRFSKAEQKGLAKYFFGIAYNLTDSDDFKKFIDELGD